jgi:hypothetical protein
MDDELLDFAPGDVQADELSDELSLRISWHEYGSADAAVFGEVSGVYRSLAQCTGLSGILCVRP